ncbi:MAG TPA: hypothetical protein VKK79_02535, partial [Candidatus Lokiarchaeia archaeon]|nr:hypothetical protein [Candidatus Lokiarchaeia archaeon]
MAEDSKSFEEDLKRQELKERRKRLEEQRKQIVEEAEALKDQENYTEAAKLFEQAAQLSKDLAEKDRMKTFHAMAKEMQDSELKRREDARISEVRSELEITRRKLLAQAELEMKEGKFRNAADTYDQAAEQSVEMGEEERAKEFQAMAKEIREKEVELTKKWQVDQELNLKEAAQAKILQEAENAIDLDDYQTAAKMYEEAARISKELDQKERAEIFLNRAREIRDIERDLKKREAEEEQRRKLETRRRQLEDERSESINKAEQLMEAGKFKEAAKFYEIAGEASSELGEKDISAEFKATAKKILETIDELKRDFEEKKRKAPLEKRRQLLIARAKQSLDVEKYLESARLFKYAAIISGEMGEDAKVKELVAKVKECMKKEKARKEEVIDRVMRAYKAIVTLRTMEPDVAVRLYDWTGDEEKFIVIYVWDVGALTLKIHKGEAQITTGEVKRWDVRIEGTAQSLMAVAQGKYSSTWAWLTGRLNINGPSADISEFLNLMIIPPLEKEKDEADRRSSMIGVITMAFTVVFLTYLPIWPNPSKLTEVQPLIDYKTWGLTVGYVLTHWWMLVDPLLMPTYNGNIWLDLFRGNINPGGYKGNTVLYDGFVSFLDGLCGKTGPYWYTIHPWIWANLLLFPTIFIVLYSALNLATIQKFRLRQTKEKLRIKRRRAMESAEESSKGGKFRAAIRQYEESIRLALQSGEDEIAKELAAKVAEIIKMIPKGKGKKGKKGKGKGAGKQRGMRAEFEKEREETAKQMSKFQKDMEESVVAAEKAMEDQDFRRAAQFYAKAAEAA